MLLLVLSMLFPTAVAFTSRCCCNCCSIGVSSRTPCWRPHINFPHSRTHCCPSRNKMHVRGCACMHVSEHALRRPTIRPPMNIQACCILHGHHCHHHDDDHAFCQRTWVWSGVAFAFAAASGMGCSLCRLTENLIGDKWCALQATNCMPVLV
jgi:hypothetical protein